jgi:hypothetical protein
MFKKLLFTLSLGLALVVSAQSFTNTVNTTINHTRSFTETVSAPSDVLVDGPLTVWFSYSGNPSELTATLSHSGTTVSLFEDFTPSSSPVVITSVGDFAGDRIRGPWKLRLSSDTSFVLQQWGVTAVPEPSVYGLLVLGLTSLVIFRKK